MLERFEEEGTSERIASRAGEKRTWPNVSHFETVIEPTRRLTWEIGEIGEVLVEGVLEAASGMVRRPERERELDRE